MGKKQARGDERTPNFYLASPWRCFTRGRSGIKWGSITTILGLLFWGILVFQTIVFPLEAHLLAIKTGKPGQGINIRTAYSELHPFVYLVLFRQVREKRFQ